MKRKYIFITFSSLLLLIALLLQSCCVYHSTEIVGDKKVSEIGIAPYKSRPTTILLLEEEIPR